MLRAMSATEHGASCFVAMANNSAAAVCAPRREGVDGAFEAVEIMRDAVGHDLQRFVVFVSADLAGLNAGVQRCRGLISQIRLEDAGGLLLFVSFDHNPRSRGDRGESIRRDPVPRKG